MASTAATYPYDMDEKDWDAVLSNNNLLYGLKSVLDDNERVVRMESAPFAGIPPTAEEIIPLLI